MNSVTGPDGMTIEFHGNKQFQNKLVTGIQNRKRNSEFYKSLIDASDIIKQ